MNVNTIQYGVRTLDEQSNPYEAFESFEVTLSNVWARIQFVSCNGRPLGTANLAGPH